ncbi:murein biosynthesis integral membrane protein MurJ [Nocardioides sp. AX2bis]|uniref:murein biosynthesis integral membrane protein MurJ n=1 Tax=Nocardioides sp. AX2bis TaxID=2653157 RepID=UPI0012EF58F5|nr:murein biosynthesis integral membrane protein MurJ [Nocardioides sp. AX2bis]VXA91821.1 Putative peptidoglycan lipid II flippase [Nocardioides sp. AX2bis]
MTGAETGTGADAAQDATPTAEQAESASRVAAAEAAAADQKSLLGSSAVMAAGTVVSRMSGFVRTALLAAALGAGLHADLFTIANTVPNMLYILLAGGVFNAVLVPQLVRSMKGDPDGGEAYTNRIITLAGIFLLLVTIGLVVAAPLVMDVLLGSEFGEPELAAQRSSAIDFARYCLPQVFFYGMFVLVGQILNARGRFGPMMWAPIANNVLAVAVLAAYLLLNGPATTAEQSGPFSPGQELLLGVGSTLGIVAQLVILVPYLRSAGFRYRPRFDFRGTGLGHTLRLGTWTVAFVIVNQLAYTVVVRLASGGTAQSPEGTGITVYSSAMLIMMVPHSVVTVSLATAILPRLSAHAAEGRLPDLATGLASTLRTALVVILPFGLLLPVLARDISHVVWGHGATADTWPRYAPTLALLGIGLVFFTLHYLMLRGFYAVERTRTVFWIQCAVSGTNIAVAVALVTRTDPAQTSPALVVAYIAAYAVGSLVSYTVLRHLLGGLGTRRLLAFGARLGLAAVLATGLALAVVVGLDALSPDRPWTLSAVHVLVGGGVDVVAFLLLARLLRIEEVTAITGLVTSRLPSRLVPGRHR